MSLQAYAFEYDDGEGVDIVFFESESAARDHVAHLYGCSPEQVSVEHRLELDRFATAPGKSPTSADLLDAGGWWVTCSWCECAVYADEPRENDEEDGPHDEECFYVTDDRGTVWCCLHCREAEQEYRRQCKEAKASARLALARKVSFAEVTEAWIGAPGGCENRCFNKDRCNVGLHFTFPGAKFRDAGSFCSGCGKVWVCCGDVETFKSLRDGDSPVVVQGQRQKGS